MKRLKMILLLTAAAAMWPGLSSQAAPGPVAVEVEAPAKAPEAITTPAEGGWIESYTKGMALARESKRPVLIDFRADWCGPCRMMERDTFSDAEVMALLKPFVLIRVDIDKEQEAAFAWKVNSIPRVIMLNVHGQVIGDQIGYVPPEGFTPLVRDALHHVDELMAEAQTAPGAPVSEERLKAIEQGLKDADESTLTFAVAKIVSLPSREERQQGLAMLARLPDRARPVLLRLLGDPCLAVRVGAIEGLKSLGMTVPEYDPWADAESRRAALKKLTPQMTKENNKK